MATIRSAVHSALESQAQARVSAMGAQIPRVDQRALVTKILDILKPQVTSAVNSAIAAQEAAERQRQAAVREQQRQAALREQQRQAAIREQQRLEAERQAALREQQRQAALREQQRLEAQRQAALLEQQRQAAILREQQRLEAE